MNPCEKPIKPFGHADPRSPTEDVPSACDIRDEDTLVPGTPVGMVGRNRPANPGSDVREDFADG